MSYRGKARSGCQYFFICSENNGRNGGIRSGKTGIECFIQPSRGQETRYGDAAADEFPRNQQLAIWLQGEVVYFSRNGGNEVCIQSPVAGDLHERKRGRRADWMKGAGEVITGPLGWRNITDVTRSIGGPWKTEIKTVDGPIILQPCNTVSRLSANGFEVSADENLTICFDHDGSHMAVSRRMKMFIRCPIPAQAEDSRVRADQHCSIRQRGESAY